jgi:hypothetical protein
MRKIIWAVFPFIGLSAVALAAPADYFPRDYDQSRQRFREEGRALQQIDRSVETGALAVPSRVDPDLTIDYLYLPATRQPEKIFVLTSGIHGVEAFAGAAVQAYFVDHVLPSIDRTRVGVLLIHALNPYGFKYHRRTTENNVDLNRNFFPEDAAFGYENAGYRRLDAFLNPTSPASLLSPLAWWREGSTLLTDVLTDIPGARAAILLGQYDYPNGIYYGGHQPEPNNGLITRLLVDKVSAYRQAFLIDLHTGYGQRGIQHFWGVQTPSSEAQAAESAVYAGYPIVRGGEGTFYKISGEFGAYFGVRFADHLGSAMSFEYGTLDTDTLLGSIDALYRVKLENQGFHFGYADAFSQSEIERLFLEGYLPSSAAWREQVIAQAAESLPKILTRIQDYPQKGQ